MANFRHPNRVLRKFVATMLTDSDHDVLLAITKSRGIPVSIFVRSIIIDALAEETALMGAAAPSREQPCL